MRYIFPLLLLLLSSGCSTRAQWHKEQGSVWNTTYNIIYECDRELTDSIFGIFDEINRSVSVFTPGSTVNIINGRDSVEADENFALLFNEAQRVSALSVGRYDPTVGALVELWGFGKEKVHGGEPSQESIESVMSGVGIGECKLVDNRVIKKSPSTCFNFSSIAKGFGCDKIAAMLNRNDVENYLIEIGGEIALHGLSHRDRDWVVQIDAPVPDTLATHQGMLLIEVTDCGIATSGNYRNFRLDEAGNRIGHTIDASTGYPAVTEILSVTIIAPSAMTADALATAMMAMPLTEAMVMLEKIPDACALIVTAVSTELPDALPEGWHTEKLGDDYTVIMSIGFPPYLSPQRERNG